MSIKSPNHIVKSTDVNTPTLLRQYLTTHHSSFLNGLSTSMIQRQSIIDDICKNCSIVEKKRGVPLFYQGEIAHEWYFILNGSVTIWVHTTADSSAFKTESADSRSNPTKVTTGASGDARQNEDDTRRRHCQGEVLVLGVNGVFIEVLPDASKFSHYNTKDERKVLGVQVAVMAVGQSFGQVGILNRSPRSASSLSESCVLLCCDKALYDRTVRGTHIDIPQSIDKKLQLLRIHSLFQQWPIRHLQRLCFFCEIVHAKHKHKANIYNNGDRAHHIYIVLSGKIHATKICQTKVKPGSLLQGQEKIELEIGTALSIFGTEATQQNYPTYGSNLSVIYNSDLLKINIIEMNKIILSARKKDGNEQQGTTKEGLRAMFDTLPRLKEYHEERKRWWNLREEFVVSYYDVVVVLTMESQLRHYHQKCGACGIVGHLPSNVLRCKTNGCEELTKLLSRLTGIEKILRQDLSEELDKEILKQDIKIQEKRRQVVHVFPKRKDRTEQLRAAAERHGKRIKERGHETEEKNRQQEIENETARAKERKIDEEATAMDRKPIWDSLMAPGQANVTNIVENHKGHHDSSRNRVNRSLSMKFRKQKPTKHMLKDAYPNLLKHSKY